jgi:hypothetical protein
LETLVLERTTLDVNNEHGWHAINNCREATTTVSNWACLITNFSLAFKSWAEIYNNKMQ